VVPCANLLLFKDVEITGSHLLFAAHCIQGGDGPGGCDAGHWRDVLFCFGAHSSRLHDAVAALTCRLLNSIVPWDDIRTLVANHLIAWTSALAFALLVLVGLSGMLSARLCVMQLELTLNWPVVLINYAVVLYLVLRVTFTL